MIARTPHTASLQRPLATESAGASRSCLASSMRRCHIRGTWAGWLAGWIVVSCAAIAAAQQRPYHYFFRADMPPGAVGQAQLLRGGPLPGYPQLVEISAPEGVEIALAADGYFEPPQAVPFQAGLLVGQVYRLQVTRIPFHEGRELYPSVEIINRLYAPPGSETRFPIPIQLTQEELELALKGQFVIRVIYLEAPQGALPAVEDPKRQRYFDVGPGHDPLEVADGLGRPMAIVRIGSRVPDADLQTGRFLFHSPPWLRVPVLGSPTEAVMEEARQYVPPAAVPTASRAGSVGSRLRDTSTDVPPSQPMSPPSTAQFTDGLGVRR